MAIMCQNCKLAIAGSQWAMKGMCPRCKGRTLANVNNPFPVDQEPPTPQPIIQPQAAPVPPPQP